MIVAKVTGIHQVTGFAKTVSFPGIAGNDLNRCDAPALQHKIRANSKRIAVFFANSRLRGVEIGGGGQKRKIFSPYTRQTDKEKLFLSAPRQQLKPFS